MGFWRLFVDNDSLISGDKTSSVLTANFLIYSFDSSKSKDSFLTKSGPPIVDFRITGN